MAIIGTITPVEFLSGEYMRRGDQTRQPKHSYTASLEGNSIVVRNTNGRKVEVRYGATNDNRTVYAEVDGEGFIGGWQYPHRAQPFRKLVESINRKILYRRFDDLPKRYNPSLINLGVMTEDELVELRRQIDNELAHRT